MRCDRCKTEIAEKKRRYEIQATRYNDSIGGEIKPVDLCDSCWTDYLKFMRPTPADVNFRITRQ